MAATAENALPRSNKLDALCGVFSNPCAPMRSEKGKYGAFCALGSRAERVTNKKTTSNEVVFCW